MSGPPPLRVTAVFGVLLVATCVTWWLGSGHSLSGPVLRVAVVATILIAFAKIYLIGREFMELRLAPMALRMIFGGWVLVVGVAAAALYLF